MGRFLAVAAALVAFAACSDKKKSEGGLPPAQEWGAQDQGALQPAPQPGAGTPAAGTSPHGTGPHVAADMSNPHAGLDMGGAGGADPSNPHAGIDMNNPHGSGDVASLGLPPPDPNRPIDPTHHVKGTIKVHPKAADRASPGGAIFLVVKKTDDKGQPMGSPLAVEKLTWAKDGVPFELTEANAMIAGTQLTGDVVVTARYDQDGDAISKQPGDIVGQVRVKIPADNVNLFLDQILP